MRTPLLIIGTLLMAACASSQKARDEANKAALAQRIDQICVQPDGPERQAALEQLKAETGLVLLCGGEKKP